MKAKIIFPILEFYSSKNYGLILVDSAGVTHYWNHDYSYDGYSMPPSKDLNTGTNLN